ncbi:hypothetical protein MHU86_12686 [Fragilaria crotonensis]|nr:hypothetical protein MHU86_12686 [Fragilaria crotonensis]
MVPGRENKVADILSRDFALDDDEVTSLIRKHGSPFVPQNFRIIPLQPALISQIGDWLRLQNAALADSTRAKRSSSWNCYARFLERVGVDLDLFSAGSDETKGRKSSRVSLPPFGTDGFAPDSLRQMAMEPCPVPFVPPSTVWLRPSGLTNLRAQSTTPPDASTPFWLYN